MKKTMDRFSMLRLTTLMRVMQVIWRSVSLLNSIVIGATIPQADTPLPSSHPLSYTLLKVFKSIGVLYV